MAEAALTTAEAAYDSAAAQLNVARTRLGLAQQDLAKTKLTAPFTGVVAERNVDPFTEVKVGETLFRLDSKGGYEAVLSVPDAVVSRLTIGTPVDIAVTTVPTCGCKGRITEIGVISGAANAVPVTVAITQGPPTLIPGMAAEVSILLSQDSAGGGFLIPLVAIAPGDAEGVGYVFKFSNGAVTKTRVKAADKVVSGNLVGIAEGVSAGDIIAAAGVSFLRDGQRVTLLGE